jgi:Ca2+-transporting ATPase
MLAVSTRPLADDGPLDRSVESDGTLVGILALHDPLRATTAAAIAQAREAGIAVWMVTGDHPATARTIGREIGLSDDAILARASPAEKLDLVTRLQAAGEVVTVTGDGVNDAPALRRADVGIAMGRSGTEAAREAASVVLTDDDFATIVAAIAEGRRIGDNIRKFVTFLLSANLGEVLAFAVAIAAGMGAPLAVVHVLLVNLVTDGLPAVALAQDPAEPGAMHAPPRRGGSLLGARRWAALALIGGAVAAVTLAAYLLGGGEDGTSAQTMALVTLAAAELALVFTLRSPLEAAWRLPANRWLNASVAGSLALVAAAVYLPVTQDALSTVTLSTGDLLSAASLAAVPAVLVEAAKAARRARLRHR